MKNVLIIQTKKFHRGLEQNKRNENHAVLSKNRTLQMFMLGIIFFSFSFFIEGQNNSSVSSIQFLQNQSSFNKLSSMASTSTSNIASLNQYNLSFSTYFGGTADESSSSIAVDGNGNSYITGSTDSLNFPVKNAFQSILNGSSDAFVAKFNATGSLMFSTYFGGLVSNPKIAVDNNGNSYIIGSTTSNTFPVKNAFQSILNGSSIAFVAKFNGTGSLVFSTYIGGNGKDNDD